MKFLQIATLSAAALLSATAANASLVTDPNDARSWQGATVGTFAQLYYGSNTLATRTAVVNNHLLDDGLFNPTGYTTASLMANAWSMAPGAGGCLCVSTDSTGTGDYNYVAGGSLFANANTIDNSWFQTGSVAGQTVFNLGGNASKAVVFAAIDHGPLPDESIESTVYLSNDLINWQQAVVERVWLQGYNPNPGINWDGFAYAVGTGTSATFKYASIIHGGSAALEDDGDNEINGMMGLQDNFTPLPEPSGIAIFGLGLGLIVSARRRFKK